MNLCIVIVQIRSIPKQTSIQKDNFVTKIQVQLSKMNQQKNFDQFTAFFWGELGEKVIEHFRVGDYVILEGVLNFEIFDSSNFSEKELNLTVFNICPFLLVDID